MTNIWGFLNQTVYLSSISLLVLLIKFILKDKLSARWQYGIWAIPALCAFLPIGRGGGYIFPRLHIVLDSIKTIVESRILSAYTLAEKVQFNTHPLPIITAKPDSITDFMFVIYVIGIVFILAGYLVNYFRLKKIILNCDNANSETTTMVSAVAKEYNLPVCRIKVIDNIPSAFVFGVLQSVMVLPRDKPTDPKVTLHELMHLKYKDLWKNVFWNILKAFHWPNPFMHYIFKTISNDMESLCDYRVMEVLEGEQRRDYGKILLSMTNEKYPSAFGTTSISNGRQFIAQRIQAISRFKLYPKGVGRVSVCVAIMLLPLVMAGSAINNFTQQMYPPDSFGYYYRQSRAKLTGCRTVAGALDTYAKAVLTKNDNYFLAITPQSMDIKQYYLPRAIDTSGGRQPYYVVDLEKINKDTYIANILFRDYKTNLEDPEYEFYKSGDSTITVPVKIIKENGWKVYQTGDAVSNLAVQIIGDAYYTPVDVDGHTIGDLYNYETPHGNVEIRLHKVNVTNNSTTSNNFMFSNTMHNFQPMPHTSFTDGYYAVDIEFRANDLNSADRVTFYTATMKNVKEDGNSIGGGGVSGSGRGPDGRRRYSHLNFKNINHEIDQLIYTNGDKFTDLQKQATERRRNVAKFSFAELYTTKANFASMRKTKAVHVRVNYNARCIRDLKINTKTGQLMQYKQ